MYSLLKAKNKCINSRKRSMEKCLTTTIKNETTFHHRNPGIFSNSIYISIPQNRPKDTLQKDHYIKYHNVEKKTKKKKKKKKLIFFLFYQK